MKKFLFQVLNDVSDVETNMEHLRCLPCPYNYFVSDSAACRRPATLFHTNCEDSLCCRCASDQMFVFFNMAFLLIHLIS
jgi:hypothetical protein